jgi:hypothetical protein
MERSIARTILITIVGLAVLVAGADAALYHRHGVEAERLSLAWAIIFSLLVAMWIDADSRGNSKVYRPYDFGFLMYLVWPLYLPYYLIRTRGTWGVAWLIGFVALYLLSWAFRLVIWLAA